MTVKRIVANIHATEVSAANAFYGDLLGMEVVMDHGWITTWAAQTSAPVQISIASVGGSGLPVPDLSIEVDDVDTVYSKAVAAGFTISSPLTDEPWGVRRFFVTDPFGKLINIMSHSPKSD